MPQPVLLRAIEESIIVAWQSRQSQGDWARSYELYNHSSGQWLSVPAPPQAVAHVLSEAWSCDHHSASIGSKLYWTSNLSDLVSFDASTNQWSHWSHLVHTTPPHAGASRTYVSSLQAVGSALYAYAVGDNAGWKVINTEDTLPVWRPVTGLPEVRGDYTLAVTVDGVYLVYSESQYGHRSPCARIMQFNPMTGSVEPLSGMPEPFENSPLEQSRSSHVSTSAHSMFILYCRICWKHSSHAYHERAQREKQYSILYLDTRGHAWQKVELPPGVSSRTINDRLGASDLQTPDFEIAAMGKALYLFGHQNCWVHEAGAWRALPPRPSLVKIVRGMHMLPQ